MKLVYFLSSLNTLGNDSFSFLAGITRVKCSINI